MAFPTDEEFEYQRRVIRERWPQLFDAIESQVRYVDEHLAGLMPQPPTTFDLALAAHLARGSKTALGIYRTCEHGFGEIAMGALRTLGETMVSAYWMSLDKDARADQFAAYAQLESIHTKRFVETMGWTDIEIPERFSDKKWLAEVEERFPNPVQGWMQQRMDRVIKAVRECWPDEESRKTFDAIMTTVHAFGDRHSHVGTSDTAAHLRDIENEGRLGLRLGPSKLWIPQALYPAAWIYGQLFDLVAETWGLDDLDGWREHFLVLLARCQPLTTDQVRHVGRNDPCPCGSGAKYKRCHADVTPIAA